MQSIGCALIFGVMVFSEPQLKTEAHHAIAGWAQLTVLIFWFFNMCAGR